MSRLKNFDKVCLILLIVGVILIGIGIGLGGKMSFGIDYKNHKVDTLRDRVIEGKEELPEFSNLVIDYDVTDVTVIAEGDSYSMEYAVYDAKPVIKMTNDKTTLTVKEKNNKFLFFDISFQTKKTYLIIHIPSDKKLESLSIKGDTGRIKVNDLQADEISIASDTGSISLENINASGFHIHSDTGKISLNRFVAETGKAETDTGNITITESAVDELIAKSDTGNLILNDISIKTADLETDTGNVECDINGKEKDYGMNLETDVGSIKVAGSKQGNKYVKDTDKKKKIEIQTATGNITVKFN